MPYSNEVLDLALGIRRGESSLEKISDPTKRAEVRSALRRDAVLGAHAREKRGAVQKKFFGRGVPLRRARVA